MRRHHGLGLLIVLCAASANAESAEQGFYLGIEAGQSRSDIGMGDGLVVQRGTLTGTSRDKRDSAYGVYVGCAVTKHFGIELSYSNLGEVRYTEERDVPPPLPPPAFGGGGSTVLIPERQETTIDSESFSLAVIGRYPLTDTLSRDDVTTFTGGIGYRF